jgi:hypothetical protein
MTDALLALYLLCLVGVFAYSLLQLHLTYIHWRMRKTPRRAEGGAPPGEWPLVTVQLPIYNERYVARRLLEHVGKLDYPPDRFEIQGRADTITEDLDLSYRAQFKGWRIEYLEHDRCESELPVDMDGFRSQQFRWMKGGAQNARLYLGRILRSRLPFLLKLHACAHLLASSIYLLIFGALVLSVPLAAAGGAATRAYTERYAAGFLFAFPVAAALLHEAQDRRYPAGRFMTLLVGWFVFSLGRSLHSAAAAIHGWLGDAGEFVRTPEHGAGDWSKSSYVSARLKHQWSGSSWD